MTTASRTFRSSANGHEFTEKLDELRTLLTDLAKSAPAALVGTLDDLKSKASSLCDSCEGGLNQVTHSVTKTVKEHPVQVATALVGVGLLTWWLLSRGKQAE